MSKQLKENTQKSASAKGLTPNMERAIAAIADAGALTVQALACCLEVSPATASNTLSATEYRGLTQRAEVREFHVLTLAGRRAAGLPSTGHVVKVHPRYTRHFHAFSALLTAWVPRYGNNVTGEYGLRAEERKHGKCIGRAPMGGEHSRGLAMRCPDFVARTPDGKLIVAEIETARKWEPWFLSVTNAWKRFKGAAIVVYLVPRERNDIQSAARRVIRKAEARGKIIVVVIEDLIEGKPVPELDRLFGLGVEHTASRRARQFGSGRSSARRPGSTPADSTTGRPRRRVVAESKARS